MKSVLSIATLAALLFVPPAHAVSLNGRGDVAQGIGGGIVSINNKPIASPAGSAGWLTDDVIVYQVCESSCRIEAFDTRSGVKSTLAPRGANTLYSGGGVWAAWLGGVGLYSSTGLNLPASFVGPVGPDGSIAVKVSYNSFGPWDVVETTGARWRLTDGDASSIQLLGSGRAIWQEGAALKVRSLPIPVTLPGTIYWPRTVFLNGQPWILYQSADANGRLVIHPYDSLSGYAVTTGGDTFRPDVIALNGRLRVAYAIHEGEAPGEAVVVNIDPASPRVDLRTLTAVTAPPPPPVVIPAPPTPVPTPVPAPPVVVTAPAVVPFSWDTLQIIGGAPDVRHWAQTTSITRLEYTTDGMKLDFDAKDRWPDVTPPGWEGPLQYTIWFAQIIDGHWVATGVIECWRGLQAAGGDVTAPDQFGKNWVYFAGPLHQPALGETIGFFVTAGNQRMADQHAVAERSTFVTAPWNGKDEVFTYGPSTDPVVTPPVVVPPTPTPSNDLQQKLDDANHLIVSFQDQISNLSQEETNLNAQLQQANADRDQAKAALAAQLAKPAPSCTAKVPALVKSLGIKIGCVVQ